MPQLPPNHAPRKPAAKHARPEERWGKSRGGRPWQRKRERILKRDRFLCQEHRRKGQLVPVELHGKNAGICDHKIPLSQGGTDSESNLETLCKTCSDRKTASESLRARGSAQS